MKESIPNNTESFKEKVSQLASKLLKLSDDPILFSGDPNKYAGLRQHIGSVFNIVNNELILDPSKIDLVDGKALTIGDGYDISTREFDGFRTALAYILNDIQALKESM